MISKILSADITGYILHFILILMAGYLLAKIAKKIKLQPILPVLILGIFFTYLNYRYDIISISPNAVNLLAISVFALIVFEISSRFETSRFDTIAKRTGSFVNISFLLLIIIFTLAVWIIFGINIWQALILSCLMMCIEPIFLKKNRLKEIFDLESTISSIVVITLPLFLIQLNYKFGFLIKSDNLSLIVEQISPWFIAITIGLATGFITSLIVSRIIQYYKIKTKFSLILAVLIAFFLSEILDGSGLVAVLTMGFIFGNLYLKHKVKLHDVSGFFVNMLEISAVFLAAMTINFPITSSFLAKSLIVFLIYLVIRYIAVDIVFRKHKLSLKERLFLTLENQKGFIFLVMLLFLTTKIQIMITNLAIFLLIYSIITSWIARSIKI